MEEVVLKVKVEGSGDSEAKIKTVKQQLREAKEAALQAKEGTEEYFAALKKAAGLADQLQDVNKAVNQLDPSAKAQAFGNLINTVAGGFQTITGLYGLFGAKSEEVEKVLLRVQAASALAMGIQSLVEAQKQWGVLKGVILNALNAMKVSIGAATGGVTILIGLFAAFSDQLFQTADAQEELKDYTDAANTSAAEQIVKVQSLVAVAKDQTRTYADRNLAIKQLNEISPKYLGNLTLETIGTEAATKAIDNYTQAILRNAKAQAASAKLVDLQKQIIDAEYTDKISKSLFDSQQRLSLGITESDQKFQQANGTLESYKDTTTQVQGEIDRLTNIVKANTEIEDKSIKKTKEKIDVRKLEADELKAIIDSSLKNLQELDRLENEKGMRDAERRKKEIDANKDFNQQLIDASRTAANEIAAVDDISKKTQIQDAQDIQNAKLSIAQNTVNGLSALGELLSGNGKKNTAFQKTLAIAQIAIDTAKSIAATISGATQAAAAGGPAAPFLQVAYITSGIASVLAAMASAKRALQQPEINQVGGGGGSLSLPTAGGITPPSIQPPTNTSGLIQEGTDFKVYVVESDITNTQQGVQQNKKKALITI